jgi:hypothetical protein
VLPVFSVFNRTDAELQRFFESISTHEGRMRAVVTVIGAGYVIVLAMGFHAYARSCLWKIKD